MKNTTLNVETEWIKDEELPFFHDCSLTQLFVRSIHDLC